MTDETEIETRKRVVTPFRLTPRIADEIRRRQNANGSTITAEVELLISKGLQLERFLAPDGRHAMDVALSILSNDHAGALRKMLEAGMPYGTVVSVTETYRVNAGRRPVQFGPLPESQS